MSYNRDNVFAQILRGDMDCVKVSENDYSLAFMDIMPQAEGHVLVIPKDEAENILTLAPDYAAETIKHTQIIARAVKKAMACEGIVIAQLNGAAAGQTVFHIHFHIIPRYGEDAAFILQPRPQADMTKLQAIAEKIKACL